MSSDGLSTADVAEKIKQQGEVVRKLKENKAEAEQVKAEVKKLLELKALLSEDGPKKLQLKCAKGTRDYGPKQMAIREKVLGVVVGCFKRHGAETIDTPVFELKDVLTGKYGEEGGKLIYDLDDQGGEKLSLRYDLTVPFARYLAMNRLSTAKRYHIAKVYRRDQPIVSRGRYREFYQCDFDIAGHDSLIADAECVKIVAEILSELNLGAFEIKVNHRRLLDGLFEVCGVPADKFKPVCSAIDKLDKTFWEDVRMEMIEQKGLDAAVADRLEQFVLLRARNAAASNGQMIDMLLANGEVAANRAAAAALADLRSLVEYCDAMGCGERVTLDVSLARGLDYYTGCIFEAVVSDYARCSVPTADDDEAEQTERVGVGSVAGGGRYDRLVGMFDAHGRDVACVGVSIGIERLFSIIELRARQSEAAVRTSDTDVFVVSAQKKMALERVKLARLLWDAGLRAEMSYKANPKMLDQMQYCEERRIPLAVIIGESELQQGAVKLRVVESRQEELIQRVDLADAVRSKLSVTPTGPTLF